MTATSPTSSEQDQETTSQVRGSSMLLVGRLVNVVLSLGIQVLLVRTLTEREFGAFGYALAVATMMVLVVSLGTLKGIPRFLAVYDEQGDDRRFAGALIFQVGLVLGLATSVFIVLLSLRSLIEGRLIDDSLTFTLTAILFFTAPQEALDRVMEAIAAVAGKTRTIFFRKYLLEPSLRLAVIVALILTGASVQFLAIGYVAAGILGSMVYFVFIVRHLRERRIDRHFRAGEFDVPGKAMLKFSLPLLSHDVVFAGVGALSVILIGSSFGPEGVADFRAVFPIARMNSIISWTFAVLYVPLASRFFARSDVPGMARAYWRSAAWLTVLTLPLFLLTGVFAGTLTETMLGSEYADTAPILTVLAVAYYFHASLGFNTYTLQTFGHLRLTVAIDLASLVLFVVERFADDPSLRSSRRRLGHAHHVHVHEPRESGRGAPNGHRIHQPFRSNLRFGHWSDRRLCRDRTASRPAADSRRRAQRLDRRLSCHSEQGEARSCRNLP